MKHRALILGLIGVLACEAYLWDSDSRKKSREQDLEKKSRARKRALAATFLMATPLLVKEPEPVRAQVVEKDISEIEQAVPVVEQAVSNVEQSAFDAELPVSDIEQDIAEFDLSLTLPAGFSRQEGESSDDVMNYSFRDASDIACELQISRRLVADPGQDLEFGREFWSNVAVPGSMQDMEIHGHKGFEWDVEAEGTFWRRLRLIYKGHTYDLWTCGPADKKDAVASLYQSVKASAQFGSPSGSFADRHLAFAAAPAQD